MSSKWVIIRNEDGKYVNQPGSHTSYVSSILSARKFDSKEDAKRDACGNETVIPVSDVLSRYGF